MKVAIIGGGLAGFACALELEKNGVVPVIFERDAAPGWIWPSVSFWPNVIYNIYGDPREYLLKNYGIDFFPSGKIKQMIMKSPGKKVTIKGNLGYIVPRGNQQRSLENQLLLRLIQTGIHFNSKVSYKELAEKFDYVVVASGRDSEAREMGLWEEEGIVYVVEANVSGSFYPESSTIYFNTEYCGTGYGRLTPFNTASAVVGLYIIGRNEMDSLQHFRDFIRKEGLDNNEIVLRAIPQPFTIGRVKKCRVGNVLLAGRAAGLTERVLGCGSFEALISGTLAARAILNGDDYDESIKAYKEHVENISSYRKIINKFSNDDFDKMLSAFEIPGVKQVLYNTGIGFTDAFGKVLKHMQKE